MIALAYGLLCHGLFIAGVGMMIWQMYFGMSRTFGALAYPWSWIANGLLLVQFPLAHSFLLSRPGRAFLKKLAPAALGADDAGITLQTGSLGWWAVFKNARPQYPEMPVQGLFRFCRQPIYLAFALTVWTVPVWTPDQLLIAITLTSYCLIGPLFKEARFTRNFGQAFVDYRMSHPYWLPFPRIDRQRNDLTIYDRFAEHWWDGSQRWLRTLQNLVPARLKHFDRIASWQGKTVLDLGCGGGFMAEALARRGAVVTGIDPAAGAIAIATCHAALQELPIPLSGVRGRNSAPARSIHGLCGLCRCARTCGRSGSPAR